MPIACVGDCNATGVVSIDELVRGVAIALGSGSLDECPAFDCNDTGAVTIDCLLGAVNATLGGCPSRRLAVRRLAAGAQRQQPTA